MCLCQRLAYRIFFPIWALKIDPETQNFSICKGQCDTVVITGLCCGTVLASFTEHLRITDVSNV